MPCTYRYSQYHIVKETLWHNKQEKGREPLALTLHPKYSQHVKYLGDTQHNCTFSIRNVTKEDSATYWFRFITNQAHGRYTGEPGVKLTAKSVSLKVKVNRKVTEGQNVTLTCRTNCSLSDHPTFIWYKDGNPTLNTNPISSVLYLQSISNAPKNISVSVSPSGEIVTGSSVTLTCTCKSNLPVKNFTWFQKNETNISEREQNYTI
ncbi:B-cell receptor CD22-like [Scleropages formosus]|uniref:B-cell receptor CD22-like n=1 Tax=Scleropages formosus TaxID=113540 RepID=UPI0010FAA4BF|nr:B-cell receptor CD22-like [Scleropages formosus]